MTKTCINCKIHPVFVKKRGLCRKCYDNFIYTNRIRGESTSQEEKYFNREVLFIKNYFNHKNWLYHPAIFRFNGLRYEPDFYDGEKGTFIEVAGSRQAFHLNKEKYRTFAKYFPSIKYEIRQTDGRLIDLETGTFHQI